MKTIDKILTWAQRLQGSCFGTPISMSIEASQAERGKVFSVMLYCGTDYNRYFFDSLMQSDEIYSVWGKLKDDAHKLLDEHVGKRINRHGREVVTDA